MYMHVYIYKVTNCNEVIMFNLLTNFIKVIIVKYIVNRKVYVQNTVKKNIVVFYRKNCSLFLSDFPLFF